MPKRKQKREGRSEEKRRAEGASSSRERADLRGEASPGQTVLCRYSLTGLDLQV
jgi:hypothetical protein